MRKINFRGQRVGFNEWVYGSLILKGNNSTWIHFYDCNNFECEYQVLPETVGQFTGYVINSQPYYENDIIEYKDDMSNAAHRRAIVWNGVDCAFYVNNSNRPIRFCKNPRIIGNNYNNPELMEVI